MQVPTSATGHEEDAQAAAKGHEEDQATATGQEKKSAATATGHEEAQATATRHDPCHTWTGRHPSQTLKKIQQILMIITPQQQ